LRVRALADAGADVVLVEPMPNDALRAAVAELGADVQLLERRFRSGDTCGCLLAFACTSSVEAQEAVATDAAASGALLCRADDAEAGDFTTAAVLRRGDVCVAVSSGGASAALAVQVRDRIGAFAGDELGEAACVLHAMRARLRGECAQQRLRAAALRSVVENGLVDLVREGKREAVAAMVEAAIARACAGGEESGAGEVDSCIA